MKTKPALLSIAFTALLTAAGTLRSQNTPPASADADHAKHGQAIKFLRAINTAELQYKNHHGVYAAKEVLLASDEFKGRGWKLGNEERPGLANVAPPGDLWNLPGWSLRLDVTADGKNYDVLLEDTTDTSCGYAAVTDERGIIRQSKAIDCPI